MPLQNLVIAPGAIIKTNTVLTTGFYDSKTTFISHDPGNQGEGRGPENPRPRPI